MAQRDANQEDAVVNISSSGDNTIVAAVAGKRIVVVNYLIIAGGTVNATWKSGSTSKSGPMPLIANTGAAAPDGRWFKTGIGEALVLNLSSAIQVSGHLSYKLV